MSVLLVDWLGRGGIAQTSEAWAIELSKARIKIDVITRAGRELGAGVVKVEGAAGGRGRIGAHRSVVNAAAAAVRERRPEVVVVQNYVLPFLERPLYSAAASVGARVVVVIHDHRLHSVFAGTRVGLRHQLQRADDVVVHTEFVAAAVSRFAPGASVKVIPLPVQVGVLAHHGPERPIFEVPDGDRLAVHFGILKRRYKGTQVVLDAAEAGVDGWSFAVMGVGAPPSGAVLSAPGFLDPGALRSTVEQSSATLLPYRIASQSGAVVLAQALGSVPVASAVGGLPEQISDGETGRLLPAGAPATAWRNALRDMDEPTRMAMAERARAHAWAEHGAFVDAIVALCR
ncbi:MAG: glycosyltransferase family 4 protein [Actinobacteria bacterium]|nr:glycosyltransferase family 4 protein [Actinomycetota bacterium]